MLVSDEVTAKPDASKFLMLVPQIATSVLGCS